MIHAARSERAGDFLDFEDFELIADLDVVVALERDPAIEAGLDFLDVVLEAAQGIQRAGPVDHVVAQQADLRIAAYHAFEHHAAGNVADLGYGEDLADLDQADDFLALFRRQHARHGVAHVVDRVVDDVVVAQVDVVGFGQLLGRSVGPDIEADHHGARGDRQVDVAFGNAAHGRMHDLHPDLVGGQLEQRLHQGFLGPLDIGLDDQRQRAHAFAQVVEHGFQLGSLLAGELDVAELALAEQRDLACLAFVVQDQDLVAGGRNLGQALDLDRGRGAGFGGRLAGVVQHGTHPAVGHARQHGIAAMQGAALDQDGGHGTAALVQPGRDDDALGGRVDGRLEFQDLGLQQDIFQQFVDALAGLGRHGDEGHVAAVFFRHDFLGHQFLLDALGVGFRLVDLV